MEISSDKLAAAQRFLENRDRFRALELLPLLVAIAFPLALPGQALLGTQVLVTMLFVLAVDLVVGFAGIVTLGHAVYFGVGAYTAGLLSARLGWQEPITAILAAAVLAGGFGAVTGAILMRYQHLAFIMLTLVLSLMAYELANAWTSVTGGWNGLMGISFDPVLGVFDWDLQGLTSYFLSLCMLVVVFVFLRYAQSTPFMQGLQAIRDNRLRMRAIGSSTSKHLVAAFALSAAIAGLAGGLFAASNAFVTIEVLGFDRSAAVMTILILGGVGNLYGALLGALVFVALSNGLARLDPIFWEFGIGLILVLIVLLCPNGLVGLTTNVSAILRKVRR